MENATITARATAPETISLMGLRVAALSERETVDHAMGYLSHGRGGWICPVNLDVLRQWRAHPDVRELMSDADLIVADGMPLVWAGGLQGSPLPERVAGSTLIVSLTAAAEKAGASIFLLGGNPGTADRAVEKLTELSPNIRLAGTLCPPFGFENDPEWLERIEQTLAEAAPDIVYVGLGFPKQDRLIRHLRSYLPRAWFLSCGISFSFVSGEIQRAPVIVQRLGLEWLHRMVKEPRRLYRRYLIDGVPFMVELMWSALAFRLSRARRVAA